MTFHQWLRIASLKDKGDSFDLDYLVSQLTEQELGLQVIFDTYQPITKCSVKLRNRKVYLKRGGDEYTLDYLEDRLDGGPSNYFYYWDWLTPARWAIHTFAYDQELLRNFFQTAERIYSPNYLRCNLMDFFAKGGIQETIETLTPISGRFLNSAVPEGRDFWKGVRDAHGIGFLKELV